ncbi:MAG: 2-oxo acid dehydrogenase subunit E2, partial [SAR324 cluster bacterium]|nr:2-oxo acid dehydrogenase subunit E2 [SAR324 cluster bacterium]
MKVEMLMPKMGESITEATISKWLVKVGDYVKRDQIILEISTDKVDSGIPAPVSGEVVEILFNEGELVNVKTVIAIIESEVSSRIEIDKERSKENVSLGNIDEKSFTTMTHSRDRFYSPLVKTLAEKHGLDASVLKSISGTGLEGRVTKEDVLEYIKTKETSSTQLEFKELVESPTTNPTPIVTVIESSTDGDAINWGTQTTITLPMDNIRRSIAEHMLKSKKISPHVYSIQDVDVSAITKWRNQHKLEFELKEKTKLSLTAFFLEATAKALVKFPYLNSSIDGNNIILKKQVNLGCAVALGTSGVIVPVIKEAEKKDFPSLVRSFSDLALRAKNKKLRPDEVSDGSFTVTNPGLYG